MKKNLLRTAVALVGAGTAATALSTAITFNTTPQSPTSIIIANEAIISAALGTDITAPDSLHSFPTNSLTEYSKLTGIKSQTSVSWF